MDNENDPFYQALMRQRQGVRKAIANKPTAEYLRAKREGTATPEQKAAALAAQEAETAKLDSYPESDMDAYHAGYEAGSNIHSGLMRNKMKATAHEKELDAVKRGMYSKAKPSKPFFVGEDPVVSKVRVNSLKAQDAHNTDYGAALSDERAAGDFTIGLLTGESDAKQEAEREGSSAKKSSSDPMLEALLYQRYGIRKTKKQYEQVDLDATPDLDKATESAGLAEAYRKEIRKSYFEKMRPGQREARDRAQDQGEWTDIRPDTEFIHASGRGETEPDLSLFDKKGDKLTGAPKNSMPRRGRGQFMLPNALYVSRKNSGVAPGSTGFLDYNRNSDEEDRMREQGKMHDQNGYALTLDPAHHRIIRNVKEYRDLVNRYPQMMEDKDGRTWRAPNWADMTRGGIYSVEFPLSFFDTARRIDSVNGGKGYDMLRNEGIMAPGEFCGEPQAIVLDRRGITSHHPWSATLPPVEDDELNRFLNPPARLRPKHTEREVYM